MPNQSTNDLNTLIAGKYATPIGEMIMISHNDTLYLLEFEERKNLDNQLEKVQKHTRKRIKFGNTHVLDSIREELAQYFSGQLTCFKTPLSPIGTAFQQHAWNALIEIPYGVTMSYSEQATLMGRPTATRAVALANSMNHLAIIIPCHRIINASGKLGGYAGGLERKAWLLAHEKSILSLV